MPYVFVRWEIFLFESNLNYYYIMNNSNFRENYFKWWVKVEGLTHADLRHLTEKVGEQPEKQNELEKTAEFRVPSSMVSLAIHS